MNTKCTYKPVHVTLSFPPLSVKSVHSSLSHDLQVSTTILLIKFCLTIYGAPIWMPFGLAHKEHCINLLACLLKKLQQATIWAHRCFQHYQLPFQLIMMGDCERLLVCWLGQIAKINMKPSKTSFPLTSLGGYMQIYTWPMLLMEKLCRSFG